MNTNMRKIIMKLLLVLVVTIGFMVATAIEAYAWNTEVNKIYEMYMPEIFGVDLADGSTYVGGFAQPTYNSDTAELYFEHPGSQIDYAAYDYILASGYGDDYIRFYATKPGTYTFTAKLYNCDVSITETIKDLTVTVIVDGGAAPPTIASASYNAATGVLEVIGSNMAAGHTIAVNKLTLTGEGGGTYTLSTGNTTASSATAFSLTLNDADKAAINRMFNKNGTSSTGGTTYNLSAANGWDSTYTSGDISDTANTVTVSNVLIPDITSASYDAWTGTLEVTGTGFLSRSGSNNDIIISRLTITGEDSATYTLTTSSIDITNNTSFLVTLNTADRAAVNQILNKNGTSSIRGIIYNIAAAEDWAAGADAAVTLADTAGNGIMVNNANAAPTATNVQVSGTAQVDQTLTGNYTYFDAEGDSNASSVKWYRSDNAGGLNKVGIGGATGNTYVLTPSDVGKYISFEVTPKASSGTSTGTAVESSRTGPVVKKQQAAVMYNDIVKTYGDGPFSYTASGGSGTGAFSYSSGDITVAIINPVTGSITILKSGTTTLTATRAANEEYDPADDTCVLTINKKALTATATANSKTYDGSTAATGTISLADKVGADDVTASGRFAFTSGDAGIGKTVNVTEITLGGAKAGNYTVNTSTTATADINKANITGVMFSNSTVTYDGTAKTIQIEGTLPTGASVNYTSNTGTDAGTYNATASITGGINYDDASLNATLTIDKKVLTATVEDTSRTYGDANPAFPVSVTGFADGETAATAAGYTAPTASCAATATTDVGTAVITINGGAATNYSFNVTDTGVLTIDKKVLTATAIANSKTYDGSTAATGSISLEGISGSDDITVNGNFNFIDKNVGIGKIVNVTDIILLGAKAGNYILNSTTIQTKTDIISAPDTGVDIIINGKTETAATASSEQVDDKIVTTITVDDKKVEEKLQMEGNNAVVVIPVKNETDVVIGQLNGETVKSMESKDAVLEIRTESVMYTLLASEINIDSVWQDIGKQVNLKDIAVNIKISVPPQDTVKIVEDTAKKNNYQVVVKPIEFEITCTNADKSVKVSRFNGYVERMVAIQEGIDSSKITTGIVLNSDGTFSHVPTKITIIDGKYYAKINSLTNSTYSAIWSPKTFKDVDNHWAKDAVNDMGSRLVVSGTGQDNFEPDRNITRAEFAAIMVRALGLMRTGTGKDCFTDVTKNEWYYDAVSIAYEYGIISGYGNENFGPMDKITREQAMIMIARAMKITGLKEEVKAGEAISMLSVFSDSAQSAGWAIESMGVCVKSGIILGRNGNMLAPKDEITRAEVAVIVRRFLLKSDLI